MLKELIKKILKWLIHNPSESPKPFHPISNPLTVEKVAEELNIEAEGKRLGSANIPPSDATALCGIEAQIIQIVQKARQDYTNWAKDRLTVINKDINQLDMSIFSHISNISTAKTNFENKANKILTGNDSLLKGLASDARNRKVEFNRFKEASKLERDPYYQTGTRLVLSWAILAFLIIAEAAANAVFFQKGIWGGLIQGFIYAAVFAFINVSIASLWGYFFISQINHVSVLRKMFGIFFIILAFIIAIVISLTIAHYRDALGSDPDNAARLALENIRNNAFGLKEVHSWFLFILSLIFATGAGYDTYSMDDKYPGYGKIHKQYVQAKQDYEIEIDDIRTQLENLKKSSLEDLEKASNKSQNDLLQLYEAIQNKSSTKTKLDASFNDAENCKTALLQTFRSINQLHRSTPMPKYFNDDYILTRFTIPDFSSKDDEQKYAVRHKEIQTLSSQILKIKEDIQATFVNEYKKISPEDIFYGDSIGAV
ncbi:MAG: hypothetical protein Q8N09_03150 [Thermodesulfovibrionia bacterium]|nr:hypothetical protein [Thermodesulfovibrionia bacterium]